MEIFSLFPFLFLPLFIPSLPFPTLPVQSMGPSFLHNFSFFAHRYSVRFSSVRFGEYLVHIHLSLLACLVCFHTTAQLNTTQHKHDFHTGACLPVDRLAFFGWGCFSGFGTSYTELSPPLPYSFFLSLHDTFSYSGRVF